MRLDPLPQQHSPALAFVAMQRAIWDPGSKVDRGFKRLVAHVASRAAGDAYSMAHTASGALHFGIDEDKLAAARDYRASPLYSAAEKAALDLASAALASEASGQRGNSLEVRAPDTRPEAGSSARAVPNAVTDEMFEELRRHWSEEQIVELVATIAMAGFLARWNTTMATPIEEEPLAIGRKHLAQQGWSPGAHLR
jgi:alkylhydroperoxidase family enzyme